MAAPCERSWPAGRRSARRCHSKQRLGSSDDPGALRKAVGEPAQTDRQPLSTDRCRRNETLCELYLGSNGIGEEGCAALADSWKGNGKLQKVDLQGASVGRAGAHAIAEALKVNRCLQQLVLEVAPPG